MAVFRRRQTSARRQLAPGRCDDELGGALFRSDVDDVGLRQLALAAAGGHVVDVAAVRRGAAVAADDARQLRRLAAARVPGAATPARHRPRR